MHIMYHSCPYSFSHYHPLNDKRHCNQKQDDSSTKHGCCTPSRIQVRCVDSHSLCCSRGLLGSTVFSAWIETTIFPRIAIQTWLPNCGTLIHGVCGVNSCTSYQFWRWTLFVSLFVCLFVWLIDCLFVWLVLVSTRYVHKIMWLVYFRLF